MLARMVAFTVNTHENALGLRELYPAVLFSQKRWAKCPGKVRAEINAAEK